MGHDNPRHPTSKYLISQAQALNILYIYLPYRECLGKWDTSGQNSFLFEYIAMRKDASFDMLNGAHATYKSLYNI